MSIDIKKSDVAWNVAASVMRLASGFIMLPIIINRLSAEDVGLWTTVFIALNSSIILLDFGFFTTFSRNITYIFSGAKELKGEGLGEMDPDGKISYPLLKGTLNAMKVYYRTIAILLALLFASVGYIYIEKILIGYSGDGVLTRVAWYSYCALLCYQFYTYFFDAILMGRGFVRRSRQIIVLSQCIHIIVGSILLFSGFGIISLVISQTLSTLVNKELARRSFFDREIKENLKRSTSESWKRILGIMWKTAYKSGMSSAAWTMSNKMLPLIAPLFIPLALTSSYGLSKTVVDITYSMSVIWFMTYYPKLTQVSFRQNDLEVKRLYVKSQFMIIGVVLFCAAGALIVGDFALSILKKGSTFLDTPIFALFFLSAMFDAFTYISTQVLLSKNKVPYYKAQIFSAIAVVLVLYMVLRFVSSDIAVLVVVPFAIQLLWNHWYWFAKVVKMLNVRFVDYYKFIKSIN
jgi:O-antigen/teichoic acid export membrane protein